MTYLLLIIGFILLGYTGLGMLGVIFTIALLFITFVLSESKLINRLLDKLFEE